MARIDLAHPPSHTKAPMHTDNTAPHPVQATACGATGTPWRNTATGYGGVSIALHWLMLVLLAAVYACMELRGYFPRGSAIREGMKTWHFMLGMAVLALVMVRLAARWAGPTPGIAPAPPAWQHRLAQLMHMGLYALMIGMPLLGWLTLSAQGKAVPFFGLQLPPLVAQSKELAELVKDVHEAGATAGYVLIGLHAAAALWHHYAVRDNTLRRMLPGWHTSR